MKNELTLRNYISKNVKTLILLGIFTLVFSLFRLLFETVGCDTDQWLREPQGTITQWLVIQRYSLVFLKYCFGVGTSLLTLNIVTYINVFIYTVLFLYFFNIGSHTLSVRRDVLCGIVLISSPIFVEQYYFTLQSAEVSFTMILIAISYIITYRILTKGTELSKRILYGFILFLLLVFSFGIYQSFVNLYVTGVLICLYKLNYKGARDNIVRIFSCVIIFALALTVFLFISKYTLQYFKLTPSSYLSVQWFKQPTQVVIASILASIKQVVLSHGNVFNLAYLFCLLCSIYFFIKNKPRISWKNFYILALLVSPFLMTLLTGTGIVIRSMLVLPLVCMFMLWEFFNIGKLIRFGLCAIIFSQIIHSELLFYSDYIRFSNDISISKKILDDCGVDKPVLVFIGLEATEENVFSFKGESNGLSFYEWAAIYDGGHAAGPRIRFLMQSQNMDFTLPTQEQSSLRDTINFTAEYPEDGYIVEMNNVYYVNLGELP